MQIATILVTQALRLKGFKPMCKRGVYGRIRQAAKARAGPEPAHINAYMVTGLVMRGLWPTLHRNRAKTLKLKEPEPDIN
jgi:hypothetical protein